MSAADDLAAGLRALATALAAWPAKSAIIGGIAVCALGHVRLTKDVDATVDGTHTEIEPLLQALSQVQIVPRVSDAVAFARRRYVLLLEHAPTHTPIDVSLAFVPWEIKALGQTTSVEFEGVRIRVPTPENLIIYKLVAFRPKDVEDATVLAQLHHKDIDFARVRRVLEEFCAVLEDETRLAMLDRIEASTHL